MTYLILADVSDIFFFPSVFLGRGGGRGVQGEKGGGLFI